MALLQLCSGNWPPRTHKNYNHMTASVIADDCVPQDLYLCVRDQCSRTVASVKAKLHLMCKFLSTVGLSVMFPAFRCNYSWFTTGRSSPAHVAAFPGLPSATGRIPFGRSVSFSRTLTAGLWINDPGLTALCWEDAGR